MERDPNGRPRGPGSQSSGPSWETELQHAGPIEVVPNNWPLVPAIYQSVKFHAPDVDTYNGKNGSRYFYSRISNPTVVHLEHMLARLQGTESALALATGIAAVSSTLLALVKSGDHLIFFAESYRPTRSLIRDFLARFGVRHTQLIMSEAIDDPTLFEKAIEPGKTRAVIFESPTNPMTRIAPIQAIVRAARAAHVLTILDGTLAGLHQNRNVGVDLYIHSLTKFAAGHGDVLGGAVLGSKELIQEIHQMAILLGPTLDPHAAFLIMRGLKTYAIRYKEESARALELARRLEAHSAIKQVLYPGLESHPDYDRARDLIPQSGSVFSFHLHETGDAEQDRARMEQLINGLGVGALAPSLGATETLITPAMNLFAGDLTSEVRKRGLICNTTVRVSVGLEDVEDTWRQWSQALDQARI